MQLRRRVSVCHDEFSEETADADRTRSSYEARENLMRDDGQAESVWEVGQDNRPGIGREDGGAESEGEMGQENLPSTEDISRTEDEYLLMEEEDRSI